MLLDGSFEVAWLEAPRTQTPVVDHAPVRIQEVEPRGFGGIGFADFIIHIVDVGWIAIVECGFTTIRDRASFFDGRGILYIDRGAGAIGHESRREIPTECPTIYGVGLTNVDAHELDVFLEALKEFGETPGPGSVGRSGKASENDHDRLATQRRQSRATIPSSGG